jgi:Bacterial Ig-like domain (group 3)
MKISLRKILLCSAFSILPLIILVRANSDNAIHPSGPLPSVPSFAGNAQHTANYQPAAQNLNSIHWTTTIDLNNTGVLAHYGSPLVTSGNTVLVPVKTATDGFQVNAFDGTSGAAKYTVTTDYRLPTHDWVPVYNPCLATGSFGTRLYYAGRGGTIYYIDGPDTAAHGTPVQQVFYTTLANYLANAAAFNSTIFINTPLTADSAGNVFFGFRVQGTAPAPVSTTQSGFARIDPNGNGTYVLTGTAANDASINRDSHNSAPALSNDETILYVVAKSNSTGEGYLLALNSTTLAMQHRVFLMDPRNGNGAAISDDSTASATVAPDGDVYIGILSNPGNGSRGFLLHFSGDLAMEKPPGGFGWDYTPALVPASMVPSYQGPSSYLIFVKYNNYAGFGDGDGVNRIALLDPTATQIDFHESAAGLVEMREVLTAIGPTPDKNALSTEFPYAVREWCINTAAVNPATNSIFTPSEDGHIYRWDLVSNSFSQALELTKGFGEPYVPTIIGPGGVVYTLNGGTLFALGSLNGVGIALTSSIPDLRTVVAGQSLTFTATISNTGPTGGIPSGTVTFQDFTYNNLTPVTITLASNVPLDASGQATVTTASLTAGNGFLGNHYITATYSGDGTFSAGSATLVQKVHAQASGTALSSSPNPSTGGQTVTFTATVTSSPAGSPIPTGMVTFVEGPAILGQVPLGIDGSALFDISTLTPGIHTLAALYYSDTYFASSTGFTSHTVAGGASPTATPSATPTPSSTPTPTGTPTPTTTPTPTPTSTPSPTPPGTSQAINLSTRMNVQTGDNVGIGGFIITAVQPRAVIDVAPDGASQTKHVLIRAIGPSLAQFGVPNVLANPVLELHGPGGFVTIINDNWRDDSAQEAAIIADGIPPSNDLEAAIDATLNPGTYTAIVKGNGDTSGVALVEVYDLSPTPLAKLANISTRAFVSTGDNIVIAGFILGSHSGEDRVVVRGLGPSLTATGVPNPLANPTLELRDGNGTLVKANNNWQDDPAQAAELTAAGLAPTNPLESGIAANLPAGLYTALLSGVSNGTGVGLVEVYDRGAP